MMKMPALAVIGADRRIVRSTETFRQRYEDAEKMCEKSPELDRVLTGRADVARLTLDDLSVEIEAVTDATGCRQAMLILPAMEAIPMAEPPVSALRDAAQESPAMVYVKDLDGRYLFANSRLLTDLRTSEQRLLGKTDRELRELETVDGPRLRYAEDGLKEPLQLEYTVPAVDRRPALAVFRFALRDENNEPVATCGVAAPVAEAQVARDEAVRLMQLERWNRLDPLAVRAELLEQWHVHTTTARALEPDDDDRERDTDEPASPTWDIVAAAQKVSAEAADEAEATAPTSDPEHVAPDKEAEPISRPTEATAAHTPAPPPSPSPDSATPSLAETAELLQTNLELARKWADRVEDLQHELQQAQAAAARAAEESDGLRQELEQTRLELGATRAQAEALREPSAAALSLSEELGRTLARLSSGLTDFDSAVESKPVAEQAL